MQGKPPATPQDLRVEVIIYQRVVVGNNAYGQKLYSYVKRRGAKVALRRQVSGNSLDQHTLTSKFEEYMVGNWWNWKDVAPSDVILRCGDRVQFGLIGAPVNWQGRNRWAIIELVSNGECLDGIDSIHCACQEDPANLAPEGTADVDQNVPETPAPEPEPEPDPDDPPAP